MEHQGLNRFIAIRVDSWGRYGKDTNRMRKIYTLGLLGACCWGPNKMRSLWFREQLCIIRERGLWAGEVCHSMMSVS